MGAVTALHNEFGKSWLDYKFFADSGAEYLYTRWPDEGWHQIPRSAYIPYAYCWRSNKATLPKHLRHGPSCQSTPYGRGAMRASHLRGTLEEDDSQYGYLYRSHDYLPASWVEATHFKDRWVNCQPSEDDDSMNRAITECLNKLGDQKVQLAVDLFEAMQTVNMIADTVKTVLQCLDAVKHGKYSKLMKSLGMTRKGVANRYLEYHFGWAPLVSDLIGLVEAAKVHLSKPQLVIAKRTIVLEEDLSGIPSFTDQLKTTGTLTRSHRIKLVGSVDVEALRAFNSVGMINPLSLGWEIVPYSFVVDWLVPIGNTLQACTDTLGLTFADGFKTVLGKCSGVVTNYLYPGVPQPRAAFLGFGYQRTPLIAFPFPKLYMKSPFSSSHVVTALALLEQVRR